MDTKNDDKKGSTILVLDFGAQYTQLLALAARKSGAYSLVKPYNTSIKKIKRINPAGIILSGGPESVRLKNAPLPDPEIFKLGIPIMGVCYGHQLMAQMLGGLVVSSDREYGPTMIELIDKVGGKLFFEAGIKDCRTVWMSHGDSVSLMPLGFKAIAKTEKCAIAAMVDHERKFISFQFHPEVEHTDEGQKLMDYFVKVMCRAKCNWNMPDFIEETVKKIRRKVGTNYVIGAVSGGIDSITSAVVMKKAIGDRFIAIFVNNGFLRINEDREVIRALKSLSIKFIYVNAAKRFMDKLKGVSNPDRKRKIIGNEFYRVFEEEAKKLARKLEIKKIPFLVQGTIYPDVIESISAHGGPTKKIKRHHNVGAMLKKMKLKLIEPFRELFKSEVREIGKNLELPYEVINRHPSPGPGEAIRCIGSAGVTRKRLGLLKRADKILIDEMRKAGFYYKVGQAFVVLTSEKTTGVIGDHPVYGWVAAIRSVDTTKFMTASPSRFPDDWLEYVANRIMNEVKGIARVVKDISSKPPSTIEWE